SADERLRHARPRDRVSLRLRRAAQRFAAVAAVADAGLIAESARGAVQVQQRAAIGAELLVVGIFMTATAATHFYTSGRIGADESRGGRCDGFAGGHVSCSLLRKN